MATKYNANKIITTDLKLPSSLIPRSKSTDYALNPKPRKKNKFKFIRTKFKKMTTNIVGKLKHKRRKNCITPIDKEQEPDAPNITFLKCKSEPFLEQEGPSTPFDDGRSKSTTNIFDDDNINFDIDFKNESTFPDTESIKIVPLEIQQPENNIVHTENQSFHAQSTITNIQQLRITVTEHNPSYITKPVETIPFPNQNSNHLQVPSAVIVDTGFASVPDFVVSNGNISAENVMIDDGSGLMKAGVTDEQFVVPPCIIKGRARFVNEFKESMMNYGGIAIITTGYIDDCEDKKIVKPRLPKKVSIEYTPRSEQDDEEDDYGDEFPEIEILHNEVNELVIDTGFAYVIDEADEDNCVSPETSKEPFNAGFIDGGCQMIKSGYVDCSNEDINDDGELLSVISTVRYTKQVTNISQ